MKDTNRNQAVKRFKVDTYIDLKNLEVMSYGVTVIYGRKQKERAKFRYMFASEETAAQMCEELQPTIGVMFTDFANNPVVMDVSKKYVARASNRIADNEPDSSN